MFVGDFGRLYSIAFLLFMEESSKKLLILIIENFVSLGTKLRLYI